MRVLCKPWRGRLVAPCRPWHVEDLLEQPAGRHMQRVRPSFDPGTFPHSLGREFGRVTNNSAWCGARGGFCLDFSMWWCVHLKNEGLFWIGKIFAGKCGWVNLGTALAGKKKKKEI